MASHGRVKEWQQHYAYDGLINYCPLLYATRKQLLSSPTKSVIVPWNAVIPANRLQRNVVGAREDFNIANGVAFSKEFPGAREMWGIAADKRNYDFYMTVSLNLNLINMCRTRLRHIAMNELIRKGYIQLPKLLENKPEKLLIKDCSRTALSKNANSGVIFPYGSILTTDLQTSAHAPLKK